MSEGAQEREILELAEAALDLAPADRQAWLEARVSGARLKRVLKLCAAVEDMTADTDLEVGMRIETPTTDHSGERVGRYLLLRVLGEGGMGQVYLADATPQEPTRVALKLLKSARLGPSARAQLEREQRVLARLQHPNIAQLLDVGMTEEGHPFFVMEYVDGQDLDAYAEALDLTWTVRLFISVCAAVMAAHRALVIHRDLKPSNILVTEKGQPKLLDFGIAKSLAEAGPNPYTAARLHTPAYASPEQLRGDPLDPTTDVYSLGVILYQLLSGALPFAPEKSPVRFAQTVLSTPPQAPSQRAQEMEREVPSKVLDAIVLRALEKKQEDRYASVEAMVEDLKAYLFGGAA